MSSDLSRCGICKEWVYFDTSIGKSGYCKVCENKYSPKPCDSSGIPRYRNGKLILDGDKVHAADLKKIGSEVARRLRDIRGLVYISLKDLADQSGIPHETLSKIESGQRMWTPEEAKKVGKILGISPQYLIAGWIE